MLAENHLVLVWASNVFPWVVEIDLISLWGSNLTWFQYWDRNWLDFGVGVEINSVFVRGSKSTRFLRGDRNWHGFCVGCIMTWFYCFDRNWLGWGGGSQLSWFQRRDLHWLGFSVGVEKYLVLIVGSKLHGLGVAASKLAWFYGGDRFTWLQCRDRSWLGLREGRKILGFGVWIEINPVFVWGIEDDIISGWG